MSDQFISISSSISPSTNHKTTEPLYNEDIRLLLEWAGAKLLSLPNNRYGPSKPQSSWPQIPTNYTTPDQLRLTPTNHDIDLIDEIYEFITFIPDPIHRRILQSRSLITPLSHQYLITWSRLGRLLSCDRRRVQHMHLLGISTINKHINKHLDPNQLHKFQHLIS